MPDFAQRWMGPIRGVLTWSNLTHGREARYRDLWYHILRTHGKGKAPLTVKPQGTPKPSPMVEGRSTTDPLASHRVEFDRKANPIQSLLRSPEPHQP